MIAAVYHSLRSGGRFVAECGGSGCVQKIRTALVQALERRGMDGEARVPWYFPTPGDYAARLERAGLKVEELPVSMRERATGESKLRGKKAVAVVVGVGATLWMGKRLLFRKR